MNSVVNSDEQCYLSQKQKTREKKEKKKKNANAKMRCGSKHSESTYFTVVRNSMFSSRALILLGCRS